MAEKGKNKVSRPWTRMNADETQKTCRFEIAFIGG